ncbi:MAG: chromosomal replication initiator protein DnaA [Myxococcota bacterium]
MSTELMNPMYWPTLREALRGRLNEQAYATWIQPMQVVREAPECLVLGLPDSFGVDWVTNHYKDVLTTELERLAPGVGLELTVAPAGPAPLKEPDPADPSDTQPHKFGTISDRYTFANFVTGPSNQLAAAAAQTVAENPGRAYNPLFVFGRVGLGKTHLIQAVGHRILQRNPSAVVQYQTTEGFVNDVVHGIQTKRMSEIRAIYRACDVLLIDDIQFIAGKEASQDEFFHTFNTLHAAEKQVIVTSDKLPYEIKDLEDRIRSRFQWGLIVDLQPPELETRIAIVRKKALTDGIELHDDVAMFIAQSVRSNVRELEGCLIRVSAYAHLRNLPLTVELAKDVLRDILPSKAALTCDVIIKTTAQHFDVKVQDIKSSKRARAVSVPRQVAMYLCRKHTDASYPEIGRALGGRDHTTAINAFRRMSDRADDPELRRHIETIEQALTE